MKVESRWSIRFVLQGFTGATACSSHPGRPLPALWVMGYFCAPAKHIKRARACLRACVRASMRAAVRASFGFRASGFLTPESSFTIQGSDSEHPPRFDMFPKSRYMRSQLGERELNPGMHT